MSPTMEEMKVQMGFPMPVDGHAVLNDHPQRSAAPINGWSSLLFGSPFAASGIFIWVMALGKDDPRRHAPVWLVAMIGGFFFLAGAFLMIHGTHDLIRKAIWKNRAAAHPGEPWVADFHWRREGIAFSAFQETLKRLIGALGWNLFLVPFFWIGAVQKVWPFLIFSAVFALLGLIFWYRWGVMVADCVRYGGSFLNYDSFPYFLGSPLRGRLRAPRNFSSIEELKLTLRCVEEKYITSGAGENRSTKVVCYEIYKDEQTLDQGRLRGLAGHDIPFEFPLPPDQPTTTLAATPPTYWEIEAKGKARGVDYQAYFLVPVYKS